MLKANFKGLYEIVEEHKKKTKQQESSGVLNYIGGTISWLGTGGGYLS